MIKIQKSIHADDYVHRKRELDSKVKEYQHSKKSKQGDIKLKPRILDWLGPPKPDPTKHDYTLLRIPQQKILQQVEALRILERLVKMLSPSKRETKGSNVVSIRIMVMTLNGEIN